MQPVLFYVMGVATTVAAALILRPPRDGSLRTGGPRPYLAAAVLLAPVLATMFIGAAPATAVVEREAAAAATATAALSGDPGSQTDWAVISHAYLGGPPPGTVRSQPGDTGSATMPARSADIGALQEATRRSPRDGHAWLALAQAHRVARDFPQAVAAYETALGLVTDDADAWADYADALASANGRRLAGKPAEAIGRALQLDPRHLKGLWLAASLDLEQQHYDAALKRWQQLRSALPPGSPDATIIDANISEARQLLGQSKPRPPGG